MAYDADIKQYARRTLIAATSVQGGSADTLMGLWVIAMRAFMPYQEMREIALASAKEARETSLQHSPGTEMRLKYAERAAKRERLASILAVATMRDPKPDQLTVAILGL